MAFSAPSFTESLSPKKKLRQSLYQKRIEFANKLSKKQKNAYKTALLNQLRVMPSFATKNNICGGYKAYKSEADPEFLMQHFANIGFLLTIPLVTSGYEMVFIKEDSSEVRKNQQDIESFVPDLFLVPLIAFDTKGHRLGFGKGYYDRYFHKLSQIGKTFFTIGIAYEFQKTNTTFPEAHDYRLDAVITEENFYLF